ncbi:ribokinase [Haloimpatiens massiliensis]|uniref:ribokinase n=1 Tax=Haloimpatiens massiliensis TaxID=1658110 RepID=UPI000C859C52|nr:ribokinase [Haloimpatiens massiliensis]
MNRVCVLGSMNMDIVLKVNNMPKVGETIFANDLQNVPGGKGANQAVAAKRLGSEVYMISKVGSDSTGETLTKSLVQDNINVNFIFKDEKNPTGTAVISVDQDGNNSIIVAAGANMSIKKEEIEKAEKVIRECQILISQFETPVETTIEAFKMAKSAGKVTILNPAPAKKIPEQLLKYTDIVVPNETEAYELTGVTVKDLDSAKEAAKKFMEKGVKYTIITLGANGAAVISEDKSEIVEAYKVKAVDTTAAGDTFIGGFSSKLNADNLCFEGIKRAVKFGNKCSSIAVQREGAQPSIPYLKEIIEVYGED